MGEGDEEQADSDIDEGERVHRLEGFGFGFWCWQVEDEGEVPPEGGLTADVGPIDPARTVIERGIVVVERDCEFTDGIGFWIAFVIDEDLFGVVESWDARGRGFGALGILDEAPLFRVFRFGFLSR